MAKRCSCGKQISETKLACAACAVPILKGNGVLEILNVGAGDIKITFDKDDVSERIRARRMVTDMLRRGYALVVQVERLGVMSWERVQAFDEARGEYMIADLDPVVADSTINDPLPPDDEDVAAAPAPAIEVEKPGLERRRGRPRKNLPMETTRATAIGRSAGG